MAWLQFFAYFSSGCTPTYDIPIQNQGYATPIYIELPSKKHGFCAWTSSNIHETLTVRLIAKIRRLLACCAMESLAPGIEVKSIVSWPNSEYINTISLKHWSLDGLTILTSKHINYRWNKCNQLAVKDLSTTIWPTWMSKLLLLSFFTRRPGPWVTAKVSILAPEYEANWMLRHSTFYSLLSPI